MELAVVLTYASTLQDCLGRSTGPVAGLSLACVEDQSQRIESEAKNS